MMKLFRVLSAGGVLRGRRFAPAAARAFKIGDASLQLGDAWFLQKEDLAFEIGEAWIVFQGMEASEECFAIRRASVERGFENREGNLIKIVSI